MIELGVFVMLAAMGAADVIRSEAARLAEERRLLRERRLAALDEDDRRRTGKVRTPIGYRV